MTAMADQPGAGAGFACRRCGTCCRWRGEVRVGPEEIAAIAGFLGVAEAEFQERQTRLTADRQGLSLLERADGPCGFYVDEPPGCRIYAVRPRQCRDFPLGWNFPGWEEECRGSGATTKGTKDTKVNSKAGEGDCR